MDARLFVFCFLFLFFFSFLFKICTSLYVVCIPLNVHVNMFCILNSQSTWIILAQNLSHCITCMKLRVPFILQCLTKHFMKSKNIFNNNRKRSGNLDTYFIQYFLITLVKISFLQWGLGNNIISLKFLGKVPDNLYTKCFVICVKLCFS